MTIRQRTSLLFVFASLVPVLLCSIADAFASLGTRVGDSHKTSFSRRSQRPWHDSSALQSIAIDTNTDIDDDDLFFSKTTDENCDHEVYWLNGYENEDKTLGEAVGDGEAVIVIPNMASSDEDCPWLFESALAACKKRDAAAARGRFRFSVSDPSAFDDEVVELCEDILLDVLDYLDEEIPSVYAHLFEPGNEWAGRQPLNARMEQPTIPPEDYLKDTCVSLTELYESGELEWSEGEPAINVYEGGGYFGAHKDHLALTVLIPLTSPGQDFEGGGTGFWAGNRDVDENPQTAPSLVLKPPPGSALVFGGDVTHAGMPVERGYRSVFVCSFSTRTPASSEDRLHGMQAPPEVSPDFKGSV